MGSTLIPTNKEDYFLFIADIDDKDSELQLLHIENRDSDIATLATTYLQSGNVVRTTSNIKTQSLISSETGVYKGSENLTSLSTIKGNLTSLGNSYACQSAQQSLVSANMALAAATIGYAVALASCAMGPWCLAGVTAAQLWLGSAGASVNSAKYAVAASC